MDKNWWKGSVTYQIYPRSYQDTSGNGIGDIPGIIKRLDHVASLGVDAIWISPVFTSPMADMGYDVSDYTDIDPLFGQLSDFDDLVAKAHDLGLKVIIDQVISHTSNQHPWFAESKADKTNPKADWYVWADPKPDGSPPTNWPSVFGGSAWEWSSTRRQYYLHNFLVEQPDLNFHCPEVQDALLDTMRFWLDRGVDGFRLDTVNFYFHDQYLRDNPAADRGTIEPDASTYEMQYHMYSKTRPENLDFLERLRALMDEYEATTTVGEVGESHRAIDVMADYTEGDKRLHMAYSFDMLSPDFSVRHFRRCIQRFFTNAPTGWPCWSFSNHDVIRHLSRWAQFSNDNDTLAKMSAAMLLSFEGSVCIYQGEELGQTETELEYHELTDPPGIKYWPVNKGRDGCRTPMVWDESDHAGFSNVKPWLPVKAPQAARCVSSQEDDPQSVLNFYRDFLAYRRETDALVRGRTEFIDTQEPLLAFKRRIGESVKTCVFNLNKQHIKLNLSTALAADKTSTNAQLSDKQLTLEGNGFAILDGETNISQL